MMDAYLVVAIDVVALISLGIVLLFDVRLLRAQGEDANWHSANKPQRAVGAPDACAKDHASSGAPRSINVKRGKIR